MCLDKGQIQAMHYIRHEAVQCFHVQCSLRNMPFTFAVYVAKDLEQHASFVFEPYPTKSLILS